MHFDKLRIMYEELTAMGAPPEDDDFYSIAMSSMPPSYNAYISTVNRTASVLDKTLSPDNLMQALIEEADCRTTNVKKNQWKEENVALYGNESGISQAGPSSWRGGHGGRHRHSHGNGIECFNCGKHRHTKAECWAKGGGKEGQGP